MPDTQNDSSAAATPPEAPPVASAPAVPDPTQGGSYTRDPITGELIRVAGPQLDQE